MEIRAVREEEVSHLESWLPTGPTGDHARRFARQQEGTSTFLVAWRGDTPVGSVEVLWDGPRAPAVRARFPDCPELNGLQVWPERLRSQGIGRTLIAYAEHLARRGSTRIGLGVADGNDRATVLYERLGYLDAGCRYLDEYDRVDDAGTHHVADPCRFLIKGLGRPWFSRRHVSGDERI
ncbi:GNAT family N-acetyltransferase [Plantactinospora sp. GCM10030261]|uniref:GNAT family N-acetyltransferase n=1 Tax=Plantactinospora sp. GCM10030261 TaxID=3273420 RepID=UPI0036080DCD